MIKSSSHPILYLIFSISLLLISIFYLRLALDAEFTQPILDTNYFEYNELDNQITNLDDISVSSKSLFNFFRSQGNYFSDFVDWVSQFNFFESLAEATRDIVIVGDFLNFMSKVYGLVAYVGAIIYSAFHYLVDIVKYVFVVEDFEYNVVQVSISNVG